MELQIRNLRKNYGSKEALKGVNLRLNEGIYGLLGPNGAGKSTLMNILTGNLPQSGGEILLDGEDIRTLGIRFRERLGYMPQQQAFYPGFTLEQFLYYIGSLRGMKKAAAAQRISWSLELLGLSELRRKPIRTLSGGMKQRLLLAQAILADPDILILDEPTAGLDPKQRIAVRNLISEIALHKIVLISTHVVSDIEFIAKELILLSEGQVLQQATPSVLTAALEGKVWEVATEEAALPTIQKMGTVCGISKEGERVIVRLLSEHRPPVCCTAIHPNLEDVYLQSFGDVDGL